MLLRCAESPKVPSSRAAVASARLGDVDACDAYLKRALANKPAQSLGTKARSSLVQALCMTPCRAPKALEIALSLLDEGSARATGDEATPTPRMPLLPPPGWFEIPSCTVWGQRPTCPPRPSEGSARSHAPRSAAWAAQKRALASAARLGPPQS